MCVFALKWLLCNLFVLLPPSVGKEERRRHKERSDQRVITRVKTGVYALVCMIIVWYFKSSFCRCHD